MNSTAERYVAEVMTCNVVSLKQTDEVSDAVRTMEREQLSALPVIDQAGKACGILSTADLISEFYELNADLAALPVAPDSVRSLLIETITTEGRSVSVDQLMSKHVKFVTPGDTIGAAAQIMIENSIHHLPVVDENGTVAGMLSTTDIVRSVAYVP